MAGGKGAGGVLTGTARLTDHPRCAPGGPRRRPTAARRPKLINRFVEVLNYNPLNTVLIDAGRFD